MSPNEIKITPRRIALILIAGATIFPLAGLLEWFLNIRILPGISGQFIPVTPTTAICFILLNLSALLQLCPVPGRLRILFAVCAGSSAGFYGFLTFLGLSTGIPVAPDTWLFPDMGSLAVVPVEHMTGATAFFFLCAGLSHLAAGTGSIPGKHSRQRLFLAFLCGTGVALAGLIFTVGYAFGSPLFYGGSVIPIALNTAISFMLAGGYLMIQAALPGVILNKQLTQLKDLNITTQLRTGFIIISILILLLGTASWFQSDSLWQETKGLYEHPLMVRTAIDALTINVLLMHQSLEDMCLSDDEQEQLELNQNIDTYETEVDNQFKIIYDRFLGPLTDIEDVHRNFVLLKSIYTETIRLLQSGYKEAAITRMQSTGSGSIQLEIILDEIGDISEFALKRGEKFYTDAQLKREKLMLSLIILLSIIFLLVVSVSLFLTRIIRKPLDALTLAAEQFLQGKLNTRSPYASANEFGTLSAVFNALAEHIESEMQSREAAAQISAAMLQEGNQQSFCTALLKNLVVQTGSQIGAIYFLNREKTAFEHYASIGLSAAGRSSFSADGWEGEFGAALATGEIQHLTGIPDTARFTFVVVCGDFRPRGIITIPVSSGERIIAVISLASIRSYNPHALKLVHDIRDVLTARLNSILAFEKICIFAGQLESQNRELEAQKTEMAAQSAELTHQNTELEIQKKMLDESSRLKTVFLSNMSHELRTPLTSVIALSGVLNRRLAGRIPEEEYGFLDVIERNGKHLLDLINNILDISRIEAGHEEIEITKFNINNLTREIVYMLKPQAKQKGIALLQTADNTDLCITSDMDKCRHILQNLISNAIKFTDAGQVQVLTEQSGIHIRVTVADTGIGIYEDKLPFIFDEFRQADSSTSRRFGGTGLGLAIAKKYADLLGGAISVKSTPGKGSEFTLTLPLSCAPEIQMQETETLIPEPQIAGIPGTGTILLVEDSEPAIIQIKDILQESGYTIMTARDGSTALGIVAHTIPDAIILDLMMPGIDGFQVLRFLRGLPQTAAIPVLILTAKHITKEELAFLKGNHIHQLIRKGDINRNQLLKSVNEMVNRPAPESVKPHGARQKTKCKPIVLVAEDNPDNMLTVKALLTGGYTVIEAEDGIACVELAGKHKPNLILMDIDLPGMNGIDAFKTIRKEAGLQQIPVIALTASAMLHDQETILAYGFDSFIAKPIDAPLFFKTIHEVLYGK